MIYYITLDLQGKDESVVTLENVNTIERLEGYYSLKVNGLTITFDSPIKLIEIELKNGNIKVANI